MLTLYKIFKEGDENFYIGSTNDFVKRKIIHKHYCKTKDLKLYQYIRENGGWDNWNMEIIGGCGSVAGEIKCIKKMKPTLNTVMYVYDYKEYMKEYRQYKKSWGGDARWNNTLLNINPSLFH